MEELTPDWWLLAARRVGSERELAHGRLKTIDFANAMNDKAPLNRLTTTMISLLEGAAPSPKLPLCLLDD